MHQHLPGEHRASLNDRRQRWHAIIVHNGGCHQSGSRFWYQGESMPDDLPAEFDEDAACPVAEYSHLPNRSPLDALFTYCDAVEWGEMTEWISQWYDDRMMMWLQTMEY